MTDLGFLEKLFLIALALSYPFHTSITIFGGSVNASFGDIVVILISLLIIIGVINSVSAPKYMIYILVFLFIASASLVIVRFLFSMGHVNFETGILEMIKFIGAFMWSFVIFTILKRNPIQGVWMFSVASVTISVVFSIITILQGSTGATLRPSGPFQNPNLYGNYLLMNVFLMFTVLHIVKNKLKSTHIFISLIGVGVYFIAILYTGSRGALISLFAGITILAFLYMWETNNLENIKIIEFKPVILATSVMSLIVWFAWRANPFIANRIINSFDGGGRNVDSRLEQYSTGLQAFVENPVFGVGYHQEPYYIAENYSIVINEVHNTYISIAAGTGIVGIVCFSAFIIHVLRASITTYINKDKTVAYVFAAICSMLTQFLFTNGENFRSFWILIGVTIAFYTYYYD